MTKLKKKIHICYFAVLREERGFAQESLITEARTARELFESLSRKCKFSLTPNALKVAVNDSFKSWDTVLKSGDQVAFLPPVAGG